MGRVIADILYLYVTNSAVNILPYISASPNHPMHKDPNPKAENTLINSGIRIKRFVTQSFATNLK